MSKEMPFDEDIMTLIMGVSPEEPGQHGRLSKPAPKGDAIELVTQIRDMCEDFLGKCGKGDGEDRPEGKPEGKPGKKDKPAFGSKDDGEEAEDEEEE